MKTSTKMLFLLMTLISTLIVMSSSNWMNMWMGMEINLMAFIPLISAQKNMFLSQSTMMYFLVQSFSSMMFLVIILMSMFMYKMNMIINTMMILAMAIKMGMPPFQMWFSEMMNKISWKLCFMLMTWQKIAPMSIISCLINMNNMVIMLICISAMTGAVGGVNQTSVRKIMAFSSMNHMSWMIACAASFKKSWMLYLLMYTFLMLMMCLIMSKYNIMFINQMNIFLESNINKMIIMSLMLSMGGLPPFLGFIPKWISIQYMISSQEFLMMIVMLMSSLITLMYYMRISTSMNLIMSHSQKWLIKSKTMKNMFNTVFMSNMFLPMMILLMNFY